MNWAKYVSGSRNQASLSFARESHQGSLKLYLVKVFDNQGIKLLN
jgi:hypothetical protein